MPAPPPQTIISLPVQTAVAMYRAVGASVVLVAVQLPVPGLYLPPVLKTVGGSHPPQTIISLPVQTVECWNRPWGTLIMARRVKHQAFCGKLIVQLPNQRLQSGALEV